MLEAEAHYWLADRTGNFWFEDSPAGPVGIAELRGFVFTDVPGSTSRGGDPVRDALNQHLQYVVMNHAPNPHEFGSRRWATHHAEQEQEIEVSSAEHSTLIVDERPHEAVTVRAAEFVATSAAIEGRIVTVVIHQADIDKIDLRLTYRRPPEPAETT